MKEVVKSIASVFHRQRQRGSFCLLFWRATAEDRVGRTDSQWCHVLPTESPSIYLSMFLEDISMQKKRYLQFSKAVHLEIPQTLHLCTRQGLFTFWLQHLKLETKKKYPQNIFSALSEWLRNKYSIKICSVINEHQWIAQFNCLNFLLKIRGNESIHYATMLLPIMTNRTSS